ncbi:MAG: M1 family metallopeptidase, partial [Planctomycetes bacterium]|nr:M1 family metallopeptidase [Planctomycetota bacterium]
LLEIGDPYFPGLGNGGYDVEHYELVLDLDMASDELAAEVTVRARALQDLTGFALDLYGLDVHAVRVDDQDARFERTPPSPGTSRDKKPFKSGELVVVPAQPLAAGTLFETVVRYSGAPAVRPDPSVGFLPGVGWDRKESGVYVVSECIGASSWYPCNDHPRDKASYSFRVTVEKPYTAAANGVLTEILEQEEKRTFVFEARDPMASYLATLNVAEFGVLAAEGPRGLPIRTYHPTDASALELEPFGRQAEVLAFLETVFGPYPFESAGAVIAYENLGGALECQTLPVYSRGCGVQVIVHELAHQWYGDCVSPALWRDIWLNEGFASYAEWLWDEHEGGKAAYEAEAHEAYRRLRRGKTASPFDPGVARVFSGRVYTRGAMVLYGLRGEVGDETFFRILKTWVEAHHDGNASTQDFVQHAARTAGRDLTPFFDAWLFSELTPEIPAWEPVEEEQPRRGRREGG